MQIRTPYTARPRASFLGGSDIAAMLGLSPHKSRRDLWLEKTGQRVVLDDSGVNYRGVNYHLRRGRRLEAVAKAYFLEVAGGDYVRLPKRAAHLRDWMGGTPDAFWREDPRAPLTVIDTKVPSTSTYRAMLRSVSIDVAYQCQLWWYMGQYPSVEAGHLVIYQPDEDELLPIPVPRDNDLIAALYEEACIFWSHVEANTVPPDATWQPMPPAPPIPVQQGLQGLPDERQAEIRGAALYLADARRDQRALEELVDHWRDRIVRAATDPDGTTHVGQLDAGTIRVGLRAQERKGPLNADALAAAAPLDRDKVLAALAAHDLLHLASAPWWKDCGLDLEAFRPRTSSIVIDTRPLKAADPVIEARDKPVRVTEPSASDIIDLQAVLKERTHG